MQVQNAQWKSIEDKSVKELQLSPSFDKCLVENIKISQILRNYWSEIRFRNQNLSLHNKVLVYCKLEALILYLSKCTNTTI